MTDVFTLSDFMYDEPRKKGESFRLYLFDKNGMHDGGIWFTSGTIIYPNEEITAEAARQLAERNIARKLEVRITNSGDFLILQAVDGKIVYPLEYDAAAFWSRL